MPFELENIDLSTAANGEVGQQSRIENSVLELLDRDLEQVAKNFSLVKEEQEKLIDGLQKLYDSVQKSPHLKGPQRKQIGQRFRLFVLLLDNHLQRPFDSDVKSKADTLLSEIKRNFGEVPKQINTVHVELPGDNYLPPMMRGDKGRKTIIEWQKIVCKAPGRNAAGAEKTEFFDGPKVEGQPTYPTVRLWLFDNTPKYQPPNSDSDALLFSYPNGDFFERGDLHADHLQPSENILYRQLEIIKAMNLDVTFREKIKNQLGNENFNAYFKDKDGTLYGTKYFFMQFHNCVNNLWLISGSANSGAGKGNEDVLGWIREEAKLGDKFFTSIGGPEQIDQSALLYVVANTGGKLLAQVVKEFLDKKYKLHVAHTKERIKKLVEPNQRSVDGMLESNSKKHSLEYNAAMHLAENLVSPEGRAENKRARTEQYQADTNKLKEMEEALRAWARNLQDQEGEPMSILEEEHDSLAPSTPAYSIDSEEIDMSLTDLQDPEKMGELKGELAMKYKAGLSDAVNMVSASVLAQHSRSSQPEQEQHERLVKQYRSIYNTHLEAFHEARAGLVPGNDQSQAIVDFAGRVAVKAYEDLRRAVDREFVLPRPMMVDTAVQTEGMSGLPHPQGDHVKGCWF